VAAEGRELAVGPTADAMREQLKTLADQLRLVWGRKQIYGTQFRLDDRGRVVLAPMEDSAHADLRREDAGLPPFAVGLCLAKAAP
jgi:hypothetical protein